MKYYLYISHLKDTDLYKSPFVVAEYKLIFFSVAKVACTEWKLMMRELSGDPWPEDLIYGILHDPHKNNLTTLMDYPIQEAQSMMNDNEWTKAVFVREPKERILSAFINKFVDDGYKYFNVKCCEELPVKSQKEECLAKIELSREEREQEQL